MLIHIRFLKPHLVGEQADTTTTTTPGWQTGRIETPLDTIKVAAHFQQSDVIPDAHYQLQLVKQIPS